MHYFISKSNFIRITRKYNFNFDNINNMVYKKRIYFLNKLEENRIISIKEFLTHAKDDLIKFQGTGFIEDSYSFVNEESRHAKYHQDENCSGLNSVYKDVEIPVELKYKEGSSSLDIKRIEEFREWFKQPEITDLYKTDQKKFLIKLEIRFQLKNVPRLVEFENIGTKKITNLNEAQLEEKIDSLIRMASEFYKQSKANRTILVEHNFSKMTYFITSNKYKEEPISINNTGYSDKEVRSILMEFYTNIKKPLIDYLIDYWIVKLNPDLDFNNNILEQLDFKPCRICMGKSCKYVSIPNVFDIDKDFRESKQGFRNSEFQNKSEEIFYALPF